MVDVLQIGSLHSMHSSNANLNRLLTATLVLGLTGALGCHKSENVHALASDKLRPVLSVVVGNETWKPDGYGGKVEARYKTDLGFQLLGRIVSRNVKLGDPVIKGQILATLDVTEHVISVRNAEAALANARTDEKIASTALRRHDTLLQKLAISQADYDQAKRAEAVAKSAVVQAQTALDKAKEVLEYADLRSDLDGVLTAVLGEVGETVTAGEPVFSIADTRELEAIIDVDAEMLGVIDLSTEFRVQIPPLEYECMGKIREISPQSDAKTRTTRIKIALNSPPESFRPGSTAKVFPVSSSSSQLSLPNTSILERDGDSFVWVVDEQNNQVHQVAVSVSRRTENRSVITHGIKPGDRVVIAGVHSLTAGQFVKVSSR